MPRLPLNYSMLQPPGAVSAGWGTLLALAGLSPLVCVPVFRFGTAMLQDELINGDGRSWQRAALRMAIPTCVVTGAAILVGAAALWRVPRTCGFAIAVVAGNAAAILFILYATLTA